MELAMERRSGLVLPMIGYELDREEMSYVDGGLYISYDLIKSFMMAASGITGVGLWGKMWAFKTKIAGLISGFFSWVWTIPFVGPVIAVWIGFNALVVASGFISAYIEKKGVNFSIGWLGIKAVVK